MPMTDDRATQIVHCALFNMRVNYSSCHIWHDEWEGGAAGGGADTFSDANFSAHFPVEARGRRNLKTGTPAWDVRREGTTYMK